MGGETKQEAEVDSGEEIDSEGLSERQWAAVIMVAFCAIAALVAFIVQTFVDNNATINENGRRHEPAPPPRDS